LDFLPDDQYPERKRNAKARLESAGILKTEVKKLGRSMERLDLRLEMAEIEVSMAKSELNVADAKLRAMRSRGEGGRGTAQEERLHRETEQKLSVRLGEIRRKLNAMA
jgi:hypothetical protein